MNVMFDGMKQLGGIEFRKGKLKNPALIIYLLYYMHKEKNLILGKKQNFIFSLGKY